MYVEPKGLHAQNCVCRSLACSCTVMTTQQNYSFFVFFCLEVATTYVCRFSTETQDQHIETIVSRVKCCWSFCGISVSQAGSGWLSTMLDVQCGLQFCRTWTPEIMVSLERCGTHQTGTKVPHYHSTATSG